MTDHEARERIRTSLDESLLVEAAAGTGKTTMLVARIVETLRRGAASVDEIVAVTFTRKAAGELKLRLRQELDRARSIAADPVERERLEQAIALLEEARIGTIHSFCAELLRERPVEAEIDPDFQEMADDEAPRLYDRAFRTWIEQALERMPRGLARALNRLGIKPNYQESPLDRLRDAGYKLVEWRDFPTGWRREPIERAALIDAIVGEVFALADVAAESSNSRDGLGRALEPVEALATWIRRSESEGGRARDHDALEARLVELKRELAKTAKRKGQGKTFAGRPRAEVLAMRAALLAHLEEFEHQADADLAAELQAELSEVIEEYERLKRRAGKLDFVDLLLVARDLVSERADVRRHLQQRFKRIFVDEFQDTDPLQAEILLLLAADDPEVADWRQARPVPGKLFLVGDPKQSIYRFRRADVLLYQEIRTRLAAAGVETVHMNVSFRAVAPLQQAVNAAFAPEMTGDREAGQSEYVPLAEEAPRHDEQPSLIALPVPRPYGRYRPEIHKMAVEESLPDAVGAFVHWLLQHSGWTVRDPEDPERRVPIESRHVCILFRRFTSWWSDVTREYVRSLEARDVPHLLIGARSFHQREEVETLRAALTAIEWPDDELMVFATLRGSLFALPDDLLLQFRKRSGSLHPFRPLGDDTPTEFASIVEALELLADLHRRRNRVPIVETIGRLLDATRAHAGFALRPAGHQVLANVQRVSDLARSYEMRGGLSFRGFVEQLTAEADKRTSSEAPIPEEGAEGVRIMTVHTAKGLEFPVVLLADPTCNLARETPDRFVDQERRLHATTLLGCAPWDLREHIDVEQRRDAAEGVRIAYVAATRARDLLVIPAVGDGPLDGWLAPLHRAIYPPSESWRNPEPAPGCPAFGTSSVLERHRDLDGMADRSVQPGRHRPEAGQHDVVWWDPERLRLETRLNLGLQHEAVLVEDEVGASTRSVEEWERWRDRREQVIVTGETEEHVILTPTEAEDDPPPPLPRVDLVAVGARPGRPSGPRFGTLVHTVLRDVELDAAADAVRRLSELHGRMLDAPPAEIDAAAEAVAATLAHDLLGRARAADRCHREAPFAVDLDDGRALEGTIDLAFSDEDGWIVVDFKTDADLGDRKPRYERQVGWYVHAVRAITGRNARGILLHV